MPRDYCPRCAAEVPIDDGVCFFGHDVRAEDVRPPRSPTDGEPRSELEDLAAAVATGEVESSELSAPGSGSPALGSAAPHDVEPDPARVEDVPEPEPFRTPDVVEPEDVEPEDDGPGDVVSAGTDVGDPAPNMVEPGAEHAPDVVEPAAADADVVEPGFADPDVVEPDVVEPDLVEPDLVEPDLVDESDVDVDALEAAIAELERRDELEDAEPPDAHGQAAWDADLTAAAAEASAEAAEGPSSEADLATSGPAREDADDEDRDGEPGRSEASDDDAFSSTAFDEEDGFVADFELPEPDELDQGEPPPDEAEEPAPEVSLEVGAAEADEPADGAPVEPEDEPVAEGRMGSLLADEGAIDALLAERDLDTGLTWEVDVPAEDDGPDHVAGRFEPEEFDVLEPTSDVEGAPEAWEAALDLGAEGPPDVGAAGTPGASDEPEAPELVDEVAGPEARTADHEVGSEAEGTAAALVDEWDLDWGDDEDGGEREEVEETDDLDLPAPEPTEASRQADHGLPEDERDGPPEARPPGADPDEPAERRDGDEIDPDAFTARRRRKGGILRRIFG